MSTSLDQKFTADAAQVEAVFEKMKRHNQDLLTQLQKLKTETKQGHDQATAGESQVSGWLKSNIYNIGEMALGYFSVQEAIGRVTQAFEHYLVRQQKAIEQQKEINDLALDAAGTSGNILEADEYKKFGAVAARARLSNEKTATSVITEISKATQFSPLDQRKALATAVLGAAPLMTDESLIKMGVIAGELTDIMGPKYKDRQGDVADVTLAAKQLGGADWDKIASPFALKSLTSVTASGAMSPETGLAMMISGFASNQNSKLMESLDDALNKHIPYIATPKNFQERLSNKLSKMTPVQRLEQIDADKDKGDKGAGKFLLGGNATNYYAAKNDLAPILAEIERAAAPGDYVAEKRRKVEGSAVFQQRAAEVRASALQSEALSQNEIRAQAIKRLTDFINNQVEKENPGSPWNYFRSTSEGAIGRMATGTSEPYIAETILDPRRGPMGNGISPEVREKYIQEDRELVQQQMKAAKAMEEAAAELKRSKAAPANPIDVKARGESR